MYNNPVFNDKTLKNVSAEAADGVMTVEGAINKTGILFVLMVLTGIVGWNLKGTGLDGIVMIGALVVNLILALVITFKGHLAPTLAPAYALIEGLLLGAITAWYDTIRPGIASNAMILTFTILFLMLAVYRFKLIEVTDKFRTILVTATMAIGITYFIDIMLSFFGHTVPMIHSTGTAGIVFSVVIVGVAAFNLLIDFDMIERAASLRAPKYMEWYSGFALLVTIVWLYLEILRLLSKLSSRK